MMADTLLESGNLSETRKAACECKNCPLWKNATQTVFGEGNSLAEIMIVGEQPGDQEDQTGRPFVGPAGKLLDLALEDAEIARTDIYLTNAVKHFKWEPAGKRRIHKAVAKGDRRLPSMASGGDSNCSSADCRLPRRDCGSGNFGSKGSCHARQGSLILIGDSPQGIRNHSSILSASPH